MNAIERQIRDDNPAVVDPSIATDELNSGAKEIKEWLEGMAKEYDLKVLLAHADDGVIWGKIENDVLITSGEVIKKNQAAQTSKEYQDELGAAIEVCPGLMTETLQQCRFFSEKAELLIWRDGDNIFQARLIRNAKGDEKETAAWSESFDEPQMLWGTHGTALPEGFTLLRDGAQGLRHAVPISVKLDTKDKGKVSPLYLTVRHYINKEGFARVVASRLVKLEETK